MKPWSIETPVMPEMPDETLTLAEAAEAAENMGEDVQGRRFTQDELIRPRSGMLEFSGCIFDHCTLSDWELKRVGFVDCVFDQCEMSNLHLVNAGLRRVRFKGCRMTGLAFDDSALTDASFENCMQDYFALGDCKLDRVRLSDCRMRESLWTNVQLKRVDFHSNDLTLSQWSHTPLNGMDMSTCRIDGIRIDLYDLRGLKVTEMQVIGLSGLLGVEIAR